MSAVLVIRLFQLQIIHGSEYASSFTEITTKSRKLKSTRGNIYDVNGTLLAYNELSNSVTLEDSGSYETTREKRLSLNGEIYKIIKIIEGNGDSMVNDFHIIIDENGNYAFDVGEGTTRDRFRADIFGLQTIDQMTPSQKNSTPDDIMELLCSNERFGLYDEDKPYTREELEACGLPEKLTKKEELEIIIVRYQLSLTSFQKFVQVTIAKDVSDRTVAQIKENQDVLIGAAIEEDSIRVYDHAVAMASIIGYTGRPSREELDALRAQRSDYSIESIIGKDGIERAMETTLQGVDGSEDVVVDNLGKVLSIYEDSRVEPRQGDDVYLTIDVELQEACYNILEQRIAGILISNIKNIKYVEEDDSDPDDPNYIIPIPIYDVYNALIGNNVIDIDHFQALDASSMEGYVRALFSEQRNSVFAWLEYMICNGDGTIYNDLPEENQEYLTYVIDELMMDELKLIKLEGDYYNDDYYKAWEAGFLSIHDYLDHCISENMIDLSQLTEEDAYMSSGELYQAISDYVLDYMLTDTAYAELQYKHMIFNDIVRPEMLVQILYDQNILSTERDTFAYYAAGIYSAADVVKDAINNLYITPAQLALDPCSGSMVVTDPNTGAVRALVSYPGSDINKLANEMDTDYYYQLYFDQSSPFYNKATMQLTAPGSTFKPVMAAAGLHQGVVNTESLIYCNGLFGEGLVEKGDQLHCWYLTGHGNLNVEQALTNSCNVFFCTVGFLMGIDPTGVYSPELSLQMIRQYSSLLNLDTGTNIQIVESDPYVSDELPIPSSIGQGTHLYTTTQLARFAGTIRDNGISYNLNLISKVTDSNGNILQEFAPTVSKVADFPEYIWTTIKNGMRGVVVTKEVFNNYPVMLYGKTGTAEESKDRPNHALFIGFANYRSRDDIAFATRIAYGYSSTNAIMVAKDMLSYYYGLADENSIITHRAATDGLYSIVTD